MVSLVSSPLLSTSAHHVRSIILPNRSQTVTLQAKDELAHLKLGEVSSTLTENVETVCGSVVFLKKLYISVNDLISLPHTQEALLNRKDDKLVDELLDRSMSLLDVCGSIKDAIEQVKDRTRNVQSVLRRRKEDLKGDNSSLLKIKDAKRAILALKQMDNKIGGIGPLDQDHHLSSLIRSLRYTSALSVEIFGSLISLNSIFVSKPKSIKWTIISGLIHKRKTGSVDQTHISNEELESRIVAIDDCLECMSRTLIKSRVSLLNIRSC